MKSYIKLTFETDSGKDLIINVQDADENISDADVVSAMGKIKTANIIEGVDNIAAAKSATLYKVTNKAFSLA